MKKTMLFIGSVIILILSAITFIFIPAMAQGAGQDSLVFGKYGNKKIEYKQGSEFANAVANYTEMYRRQGIDLKDSDYYTIYNYAFVSAVQANERLLIQPYVLTIQNGVVTKLEEKFYN